MMFWNRNGVILASHAEVMDSREDSQGKTLVREGKLV